MASLVDTANLEPIKRERVPSAQTVAGVPIAQRVRVIDSIQTDLLIQSFNDRILVILTQLGRIGCLLQVLPPPPTLPAAVPRSSDGTFASSLPPPHPSLVVSPLFGVPPSPHVAAVHDLYASQISAILFEKMSRDSDGLEVKPVVIGIGLRPPPPATGSDGDDEERGGVTDRERDTFMQVMEMVTECIR